MGLKEHQIGRGTLGYKGETREYYESKRGVWDHFRWVLAAICLVLGAAFLVASASPVVAARVVSVTDNGVAGTNTVVLVAPDGATSSVTIPYADTPAVGSTEQAMELPGGRLVLGDHSTQGRGAAPDLPRTRHRDGAARTVADPAPERPGDDGPGAGRHLRPAAALGRHRPRIEWQQQSCRAVSAP